MKTFTYSNQKFTPATLKKLRIVFVGNLDECEEYAEKLEKESKDNTFYFVGSFNEYRLTSRKTLELLPAFSAPFDKENCFVRYLGEHW